MINTSITILLDITDKIISNLINKTLEQIIIKTQIKEKM